MDAIIIIVLIIVVGFYFRKLSKVVYAVGIIDIFLRIFNYLISNIQINGISEYVERYLPSSIPNIIGIYTHDIIYDLLMWVYVIFMIMFLVYNMKYFFNKK